MDMIAFTIILVLFISLITNNSASSIPNDGMVNNIQNNNVNNNQTNEQNENQNNNLNIGTIEDHDLSI